MRRHLNPQSSFDLFLDTVCNMFGGIVFIAILIIIQVRHTVEQPAPESCSPELIVEMAQRAEGLAVEIESANMLLETIRKTMPEPVGEEDKIIVTRYSELLEKKSDIVTQKSEVTRDYLTWVKENAELELQLKEIEKQVEELNAEELLLMQTTQVLQNEQQTLEQQNTELKNSVRSLETEVAQKTNRIQDKQNPDNNSRKEELHLPKLRDSGHLRPFYLVLRFNRLYVVDNRGDFDNTGPRGNYLGVPKRDRGIVVDDYDITKRQIRSTFQSVSPTSYYIGIFVYGDSVDSFYIVRDAIIGAGFRYELVPSPDDLPWYFGSGSGTVQVQ